MESGASVGVLSRAGVALRRWRRDGTLDILAGSLVAGVAALAYEVAGGRVLGAEAFAAVSALLTIHFLAFSVVLLPLEQVVIRRLTMAPDRPGVPVGAVSLVAVVAVTAAGGSWLLRGRLFDGDGWYALIVMGTVSVHGIYAAGRGHLAARHRYRSYGMSSGAATVLRLAVAGALLAIVADARLFSLALVAGPLVIFAWRPFGESVDASGPRPSRLVDVSSDQGRLMGGLILAAASSQALLVAGPAVAAVMGASAATVSIVFATFTLLRAPISLGSNLIARLLPPFTAAAKAGELHRLATWSRRVAAGGGLVAVVGAAVGAMLGPSLVAVMFGSDFRPEGVFTALVVAGVALAGAALVIGQVFVARGDANRLADAWLLALGAAAVCLALPLPTVADRVAGAFLAGEVCAVVLMVHYAGRPIAGTAESSHEAGLLYRPLKRLGDAVIAGVAGCLALPVMAAIAIAIAATSGRPVLVRQTRIGHRGAPFSLWKFRTMTHGTHQEVFARHLRNLEQAAEQGLPVQPDLRIHNDPRVTRLGARLRRSSLDELPNLWSVLKGDMSLVGPRPLLSDEVGLVERVLGPEAAATRAEVPPGITGLAQVEGRDDITVAERSALDAEYVAFRSLSLDLLILLKTFATVVRHRGT